MSTVAPSRRLARVWTRADDSPEFNRLKPSSACRRHQGAPAQGAGADVAPQSSTG